MNREIEKLYIRCRKHGMNAAQALSSARTIRQFNTLADHGFVRIDAQPDDDADLSFLDQDCYPDTREGRAVAKLNRDSVERDGVWGTIGEFRTSEDRGWNHADSVWGHIGYSDVTSPFENWCVVDTMQSTIDALKKALADRFCRKCGHRSHAA